MNSEMVSIVMATYNGEKYLRQQLDSILQQTHQNFELIVVDDASTDTTLFILDEYAATDSRISVFSAGKNSGLVANFERGLRLAKGDFIALSDQDDFFRQDKLERLLAALKDSPNRDLVISDLSLIDEEGNEMARSMWRYRKLNPIAGKPFRRLLYKNFATGCAMMFRRRLLEIALPFPQDCLVHDWWLAVVSASAKGGGICLVKEPLTAYRQHQSNVIGVGTQDNLTASQIIARIKSPPRGASALEARLDSLKPRIARLDGYLLRDMWTADERLMIKQFINTLEGYRSDARSGLLSRVSKLPQRLRCALLSGNFKSCFAEVFITIWPYK